MATSAGQATSSRRALWGVLGVAVLVIAAVAAAVVLWSGATLASDDQALARVDLQPFAGKLVQATASGPDGKPITLVRRSHLLTPTTLLAPGQTVNVEVVIKRPSWVAWALGHERREHLTIRTPAAKVTSRWLTARGAGQLAVPFDQPVAAVAYGARRHPARGASVLVPAPAPAGSIDIAAAARDWESTGPPVRVTWFPPAGTAVALSTPAAGTKIAPAQALRLTFSKPVDQAVGSAMPKLDPPTQGRWRRVDSHTLSFHPSGFGARIGGTLTAVLPRPLAVANASGANLHRAQRISWTVKPPSTLRLQQLLAQAGYLPVDWTADGEDVGLTPAAQARAMVDPPQGSFSWRYPNTPHELTSQWKPGQPNQITRGAVMMFQDDHHLSVDSFAGPAVWQALMKDVLAQKRRDAGYSYVYVHRKVPQKLTLWHNGRVVLTSPGNTGVPAAPTQLGTFPVFEHIAVGTMSGTNPDGSHYHDPGIKWISYFNGGEALHAFPRASFGTPQSLGCVELPLASAKKVWPYTPIGTLVTVEN